MAFSTALKTLRKARSLTQEQLAVLTGISKSAISMYENGNRFPDEQTLRVLSNFFKVDMNSLLGESDGTVTGFVDISDRPYLEVREVALLAEFEKLNDANRGKVFSFIGTLVELQKIETGLKAEKEALEWYKAHKQKEKQKK